MSQENLYGLAPEGTITLDEACRILGVSSATLHRWEAEGTVSLWKSPLINKRVRYNRDEVEELAARINVPEGESLDTKAAADFLGLPDQTVRRLEQRGHLHSVRTLGNHRRYPLAEVAAFKKTAEYERIRNRRQTSDAPAEWGDVSTLDSMDGDPEGYVYAETAAEFLGVQRGTLRKWEREGKLVAHPRRHQRRVLYPRGTIQTFKDRRDG